MVDLLLDASQKLVKDCFERGYEAFLEADIVCWLFHILLLDEAIDGIHLHTGGKGKALQRHF